MSTEENKGLSNEQVLKDLNNSVYVSLVVVSSPFCSKILFEIAWYLSIGI